MHSVQEFGCLLANLRLSRQAESLLQLHVQLIKLIDGLFLKCDEFNTTNWTPLQIHAAYNLLRMSIPLASVVPDCWLLIFDAIRYISAHRLSVLHLSGLKSTRPSAENSTGQVRSNKASTVRNLLRKQIYVRQSNNTMNAFRQADLISSSSLVEQKASQETTVGLNNLEELQAYLKLVRSKNSPFTLAAVGSIAYPAILDGFEEQIQLLFKSIATELNLPALLGAMRSLVMCSAGQLSLQNDVDFNKAKFPVSCSGSHLLLGRLADLLPNLIRSGRPLIHLMSAYPPDHFLEAASASNALKCYNC